MTETVEVVAARPLNLPAGRLEGGELFPTPAANVAILAGMGMLQLADDKTGEVPLLDRAVAAGAKAREALDKRRAQEVKEAEDAAAKADKADTSKTKET